GSHPPRLADHGGAGYSFPSSRGPYFHCPKQRALHAVCTWYVVLYISDEAFCCQRSGDLDQSLRNWSKKGRDLNLMLAYSSIKALRTRSSCALVSSFTRTSPIRSGV